jgi:hypothetical protein
MTKSGKFLTDPEYDFTENPIYSGAYKSFMWHNKCSSKNLVEIFRIHLLLILSIRVEMKSGMAGAYLFHFSL